MRKRMKSGLLAGVLVLAMVLSFIPVDQISAAETNVISTIDMKGFVPPVDGENPTIEGFAPAKGSHFHIATPADMKRYDLGGPPIYWADMSTGDYMKETDTFQGSNEDGYRLVAYLIPDEGYSFNENGKDIKLTYNGSTRYANRVRGSYPDTKGVLGNAISILTNDIVAETHIDEINMEGFTIPMDGKKPTIEGFAPAEGSHFHIATPAEMEKYHLDDDPAYWVDLDANPPKQMGDTDTFSIFNTKGYRLSTYLIPDEGYSFENNKKDITLKFDGSEHYIGSVFEVYKDPTGNAGNAVMIDSKELRANLRPKEMIMEIPVKINIEQLGTATPGKETFKFETFKHSGHGDYPLEDDSITIENLTFTDDKACVEGTLKLKGVHSDDYTMFAQGIFLRMSKGTSDGWTYATEEYFLLPRLKEEVALNDLSDLEKQYCGVEPFILKNDGYTPITPEEIVFNVSYDKEEVIDPEKPNPENPETPEVKPGTPEVKPGTPEVKPGTPEVKPGQTNNENKTVVTAAPKTADNSDVMLMAVIFMLALGTVITVNFKKSR